MSGFGRAQGNLQEQSFPSELTTPQAMTGPENEKEVAGNSTWEAPGSHFTIPLTVFAYNTGLMRNVFGRYKEKRK